MSAPCESAGIQEAALHNGGEGVKEGVMKKRGGGWELELCASRNRVATFTAKTFRRPDINELVKTE